MIKLTPTSEPSALLVAIMLALAVIVPMVITFALTMIVQSYWMVIVALPLTLITMTTWGRWCDPRRQY